MLDPERSEVEFEGRSTLHPIHASAPAQGELDLSAAEGRLKVAVREIKTGNPLMDRELRRRLDARHHPSIEGRLDELASGQGDGFTAEGTVVLGGASQSVGGELVVREDPDGTVSITGEHTFDIRDFGLDPPKVLGLKVEPEVVVRLTAVGVTS